MSSPARHTPRVLSARLLRPRLARLALLCADVDGTLTDGRIVVMDRGELRNFSARDGMGVQLAKAGGMGVGGRR